MFGRSRVPGQDIDVGKRLGAGKFGSVYVARCRRTGHRQHTKPPIAVQPECSQCCQHVASGFIFALKVLDKRQLIKHRVEHQLRHVGCVLLLQQVTAPTFSSLRGEKSRSSLIAAMSIS